MSLQRRARTSHRYAIRRATAPRRRPYGLNVLFKSRSTNSLRNARRASRWQYLEIGFGERNTKQWTRIRRDDYQSRRTPRPLSSYQSCASRRCGRSSQTRLMSSDRARPHDRSLRRLRHAAERRSPIVRSVRLQPDRDWAAHFKKDGALDPPPTANSEPGTGTGNPLRRLRVQFFERLEEETCELCRAMAAGERVPMFLADHGQPGCISCRVVRAAKSVDHR